VQRVLDLPMGSRRLQGLLGRELPATCCYSLETTRPYLTKATTDAVIFQRQIADKRSLLTIDSQRRRAATTRIPARWSRKPSPQTSLSVSSAGPAPVKSLNWPSRSLISLQCGTRRWERGRASGSERPSPSTPR
jgi:hypothetical protein